MKDLYSFCFVICIFLLMCGITIKSQENQDDCKPICPGNQCKCPDDLFLFEDTENRNVEECKYQSTTTTNYSTSSPQYESSSFSNLERENRTVVCRITCPKGYYDNTITRECAQCDSMCSNCTGSGETMANCTCLYGRKNNETCAEKSDADKGGIDLAMIAGAAAGGVIVAIIVTVVVVVCVCRRRSGHGKENKMKSRMSTIIESRDNTIDNRTHIIDETKPQQSQQDKRKNPTLTRPNYENTGKFDDSKVANQAQLNQDKIFRYTKEPSTTKTRNIEENTVSRDSGLYGNADAIRLHRNISDEVELSMLGEAPRPPGQNKKTKRSARKTGRKNKHGVTNPAVTIVDEQENYEDMSGQQENYTPFDPNADDDQEDYENYQKQDEEPLEDYENFGKTASLVLQEKVIDNEEDQEDYENFSKDLIQPPDNNDDDLEDYENAAALAIGGPPSVHRKGTSSRTLEVESPYMNVGDIRT